MSKVFVGLSGGVDSAVSAALLKQAGHDVTAVFMKNWSGVTAGVVCPWEDDYRSARQVAAHLRIPLKLYDFEKQYRNTVGQYLIETYQSGLTPNPDIMCNEEIKFKAFLQQCLSEGADKIATGHYARIIDGQLRRGLDRNKDQSYFLYRIDADALEHSLFPVGELTKPDVREQAKSLGLPNASRRDSQGICFVGPVPMKDFLHEFIEYKVGDVIDEHGKKVGQHDGVFFYTIGQRHGLGIGGGKPYFVYDKDVARNILYVTVNPEARILNQTEFEVADCVWHDEPKQNYSYIIQTRYRAEGVPGTVTKLADNHYRIVLEQPERAITPGQSAVVYDGDQIVGGGIIQMKKLVHSSITTDSENSQSSRTSI